MKYVVEISDQAEADLRRISEHIAFELRSIQNADGQLKRLEKSICALDEMPERYQLYGREPWCSRGLRSMSVDNFCVFYISDTKRSVVSIVRVMYSGRDYSAQLADIPAE